MESVDVDGIVSGRWVVEIERRGWLGWTAQLYVILVAGLKNVYRLKDSRDQLEFSID